MFNNILEFNKSYRVHQIINTQSIDYQLYIDSRDLLGMISGTKSLVQNGKFDEIDFTSENTLIRALIFENKINNFKILLPHEDEVLYNIERYKTIYNEIFENEKDEVLYYFKRITGISIDNFLNKNNDLILNELEKNGKQFFIIKYLLDIFNWKQRLKYLWTKNIYQADDAKYNFELIFNSSIFNTILNQGFEKVRPNHKNSNIVDTIVLCILHEKLQSYINNKSNNKLPIFYDSSKLFNKVIKSASLENEFIIQINSHKVSILQDESFLLISALLSVNDPKVVVSVDNYKEYNSYINFLKKNEQSIHKKSIDKNSLNQINKYINNKFLTLFWESYKVESFDFIEQLRKLLTRSEIKQKLEDKLEDIIDEIKLRIKYYSVYRKTYTALIDRQKEIRKVFTQNINRIGIENLNVFRDYGITRFSLSQTNCSKLINLTKEIFKEEDENEKQLSGQLSYVGKIITNGFLENNKKTQDELAIGLAILWILNKYDLILQILENYKDFYHYSLGLIYASSLAKHRNTQNKTKKAISILEKLNKVYPFIKNYKTSIGASYVYYHLWENNNDRNFRISLREPSFCGEKDNINCYLRKAVQLAEIAINHLEKNSRYQEKEYRKNKYYYIINNYIYYITMGMCDEKFDKLQNFVDILEGIEATDKSFWEYRFDDTLSLYYLRKGLKEKDFEMILIAKEHNRKAKKMVLMLDDSNIIDLTKRKINKITKETLPNNVYKALGE